MRFVMEADQMLTQCDCGARVAEGRRYCGRCGANIAPACGECGYENEAADRFCGGCGAQLLAHTVGTSLRLMDSGDGGSVSQADLDRLFGESA